MMSFNCLRFCEDTPFLAVQLGESTVWGFVLVATGLGAVHGHYLRVPEGKVLKR
jgi:hypothetical protein